MTTAAGLQGDARFTELVTPHRAALLAHCYRMTGSLHDAEDALQDALLRAWRSFDSFEGRSSLRTWLFTIATNACRRLLERRERRVLPVDFGPPADPHDEIGGRLLDQPWLTPFPTAASDLSPADRVEQKEDVELAFVAALQHLPARQRAVLLLRDVLAFSAQETAEALASTQASVNSALQRAHKTLDALPRDDEQAHQSSPAATREIVARFVTAWERADIDALVGLLAEDVELSMPPYAAWFRGRDAVVTFLRGRPLDGAQHWRGTSVTGNDRPGFALYLETDGEWAAHSINLLTLRGPLVSGFVAFMDPTLFPAFGLPLIRR